MKIYSASILVLEGDKPFYHYPLVSGVNKYNSCQDYLDRGAIPYINQSPSITDKTTEVSLNVVEGEILEDGSIVKTGGIDKTLYFNCS
ncbi:MULTISPECIES: hypothetical protein [Nostoc]|uniref:Uncharacterized protein n=1 Tax=Nostoc paludosum FACHB-159 TaxID=2692908 RepID=A0ABR8KJA6_9NOSO|nr:MULTISPECIES: hypothetical protein [Nostoc]MBD2683338.1 hypothetical protein [Nostoc sp. FACHB-857]MBD2739655.1 hypothetical protein [Nostoc paludosum FACHB-159]